MSQTIRRVTAGETIDELQEDVVNEAANFQALRPRLERIGMGGPPAGPSGRLPLVQNKTGAALSSAAPVLAYGDPVRKPSGATDPAAVEDPVLEGTAPTGGDSRVAILAGGCPDGGLRSAVIAGLAWARVDFSDAAHAAAEAVSGDTAKLASAASGAIEVVWKEDGTGELWALVRLGGGGGGGSTLSRGVVVDDLPGYAIAADLRIVPTTLRCLLYSAAQPSGYEIDQSQDWTRAEPGLGVRVTLSDEECSEQATAQGGLFISRPVMTDNQLDGSPDESTTVTIAGGGADPSSTVNVSLPRGGAGPFNGLTVNADGTWSTGSVDLSAATTINGTSRGIFEIKVEEVRVDAFVERPRYAIVTHQKAWADLDPGAEVTNAQEASLFRPTIAPDLLASSDTGGSQFDNLTADQTPTVRVFRDTTTQAFEPYEALVYSDVDGLVGTGADNAWIERGDGVSYQDVTLSTLTDAKTHHLVYTLGSNDAFFAGHEPIETGTSPPLEIVVNTALAGGEITATTQWFEDRASTAADLKVKTDATFVITNPTANPDPALPAGGIIDQPSPPIGVVEDNPVKLQWDGSEWQVLLEESYGREVLIDTGQTPPVIVQVAACRAPLPNGVILKKENEP